MDPTLPYNQISQIVNISPPTVKKRINNLKRQSILQGIHAEYHPEALGLESHIFLLRVNSIDKLLLLERVLDYHPYLVIRSRCYGAITGIFMKVHIPEGTIDKMKLFLEHLKDYDLISEIVHSTTIGKGIKTRIDLTYWDQKTAQWLFKWTLWNANKDSVDYVPHFSYFQRLSHEKPKNVLKRMKHYDFQILHKLVLDATQKQSLLAEEIGIPQYTFSRRLKFLNENVIRNYVVTFDRMFFGLTDELIFKAVCSKRAMSKIIYLLQNLPLPFESDFRSTEDGFLWKILLPPDHKLELMNILWALFPDLQIMMLDPDTARTKPFNPENYSFSDKQWKDTYEFMVDSILQKARKEQILA